MGPRIAFVDDDSVYLDQLRRILRTIRHEWEMLFFEDPAEALGAFVEIPIDVLVSDWIMPEMDGLALCKKATELHAQASNTPLYTIFLTEKGGSEATAEALDAGVDDFVAKPFSVRELVARIKVGLRFVEGQRALHKANEQLALLAMTDPLTGLFNRKRGREIITAEMARVSRGKQQLSLVLLNLDSFHTVNQEHGNEAGDALLFEVASRLQLVSRQYDSVVRWAGEELLVICPHTCAREVEAAAERFRATIADRPFRLRDGTILNMTGSFGTVSSDDFPETQSEDLIRLVDEALREAKQSGRNRVVAQRESQD